MACAGDYAMLRIIASLGCVGASVTTVFGLASVAKHEFSAPKALKIILIHFGNGALLLARSYFSGADDLAISVYQAHMAAK